jgi:mannose-6-phosphate isomerase-like protein (cupin superfamily)
MPTVAPAGAAANLTALAERLPPQAARRLLAQGEGGLSVDLLPANGAEAWPEEAPAARDALYAIIAGEGLLRCGAASLPCAAGDLLFVPAGMPRRFEGLSRGFATWRILA